jgi:dTMP kinase
MPGRFVTIEGIDASGKSSLVAGLVGRLRERGLDAVAIQKKQVEGYSHPFVERAMRHLRAMLWDAAPDDPVAMLEESSWTLLHTLWYEVMQAHLLAPLLARHDVVVADGWSYKFLARHRVHRPDQAARTAVVMDNVRDADMVLLLDVPPEECWARRPEFRPSELGAHAAPGTSAGASARDQFVTYQGQVSAQFHAMAAAGRHWRTIEAAGQTPERIVSRMVDAVMAP